MAQPIISILTPTYQEKRIRHAVESIFAQDFTDWELIIIDDGSGDDYYREFLAPFKGEEKITVLRAAKHIGLPGSLNLGLVVARGVVIARQDADDVSAPPRLRKQLCHMIDANLDGVSCQFDYLPDSPDHPPRWDLPTDPEVVKRGIFDGNVAGGGGYSMCRAAAIRDLGGWKEIFSYAEDWALWIDMVVRGFPIGIVDEILYHIWWKHAERPEPYLESQARGVEQVREYYKEMR